MRGDSYEHYVELVQDRVLRAELWRRFPDGWETGDEGGPSWKTSAEHVRPQEPRYYARRCRLFTFAALARFHFAVRDLRLRRISIVFDPIYVGDQDAAGSLTAALLNHISHASDRGRCLISGEQHLHDGGVQIVIDIEAVDDPPASMEQFFVYWN